MAQTILITGANNGLGWNLTETFVKNPNNTIIMACRSVDKAQKVITESSLTEDQKNRLKIIRLDLGNQKSVQACVSELQTEYPEQINTIICNAGVFLMNVDERKVTSDGFEMHYGTNHLGHFTFCLLLLQHLKLASIKSGLPSKIICTSSIIYERAKFYPNDIQLTDLKKYNANLAYSNSKIANLFFVKMLNQKLSKEAEFARHVRVYCTHPGVVATDLFQTGRADAAAGCNPIPKMLWWMSYKFMFKTVEQGNYPTVYCVSKRVEDLRV